MDIKIMIVDDEVLQLRLVSNVIRALKPTYQLTMLSSPQEALKILEKTPYDILLSDIKMPKMDGIELVRMARTHYGPERLRVVILSGFNDFEYAKSAIQLGVCDYLLKPVSKKSLEDVFEKIEQQMGTAHQKQESEQSSEGMLQEEYFFYKLLTSGAVHQSAPDTLSRQLSPRSHLCLLLVEGELTQVRSLRDEVQTLLQDYPRCYSFGITDTQLAVIISYSAVDAFDTVASDVRNQLKKLNLPGLCAIIAYSRDPQQIHTTYLLSRQYLQAAVFVGGCDIFCCPLNDTVVAIAPLVDKLCTPALQSFRPDDLAMGLETLRPLLTGVIFDPELLKKELSTAVESGFDKNAELFQSGPLRVRILEEVKKKLLAASCYDQLVEVLLGAVDSAPEAVAGTAENAKKNYELYIACRYMDSTLTLNKMSEDFNYNPSYFSNLFVKQFGMTFSKYLTDFRLEKACLLLKETDKKNYEIASLVGIQDSSYFVMLFGKYYGVSPKRYRQLHRTQK